MSEHAQPFQACIGHEIEHCLCASVARLRALYADTGEDRPDSVLRDYPDTTRVIEGLRVLLDAMFPGRVFPTDIQGDEIGVFLMRRLSLAWRALRPEIEKALPFRWIGAAGRDEAVAPLANPRTESIRILREFMNTLPDVRALLIDDVRAAYEGDPAALTYAEIQLAYPGLLAIASHRIAHELHRLGVPVIPRIMSEWTHAQTGVDIHPGARIGRSLFIDHATGVVIGETAVIGDRVKIYQGVTLGARSFALDEHGHPVKHIQRHPTVEDDVVIYANATILGGRTVIGRGSIIGGNVFLTHSVPPNSVVTMEQAHIRIKSAADQDTTVLPSPEFEI